MKKNMLQKMSLLIAALTLSLATPFTLPVMAAADAEETPALEGIITIEAPDIINNVDPFDVSGSVSYRGGDAPDSSHVFLEIVNQDPEKPYIHEIQLLARHSMGQYKFESIRIPSGYADGTYLISVYLFDDMKYELLADQEKAVTLINQ